MKPAINDKGPRDQEGRLLLGNPSQACRWCGAQAVVTYSGCGRIAWWHPPTDCCPQRKAAQAKHHPAGAPRQNYANQDREPWWHR